VTRRLAPLAALSVAAFTAQPWRTAVAVTAIALGVGMGSAVHLINRTALAEFTGAVRFLIGDADLEVRGPREGFDEALYETLAARPEVAVASPLVDVEVQLADPPAGAAGRGGTLRVLGTDLFTASAVNPGLTPEVDEPADTERRGALARFDADTVFLSPAAAGALDLRPGDRLALRVGLERVELRVAGLLARAPAGQQLAVMDIGAAQWRLGQLGRVQRIDLKLAPGVGTNAARAALAPLLPAGVVVGPATDAIERTSHASRAYRVNLEVLAMVALFTGAFLVFATQALSVLRRRAQLALLRVLGVPRAALARRLAYEAAALGAAGGLLGTALGHALAAWALARFGADLGGGFFPGVRPALEFDALTALAFVALGVLATVAGALLPALEAARMSPAQALRAGDVQPVQARPLSERPGRERPLSERPLSVRPLSERPVHERPVRERPLSARLRPYRPALALLAAGALAAALPPLAGLPIGGYAAIALWLVAGIAVAPRLTRAALARLAARSAGAPVWWSLAAARAAAPTGLATLGLGGIVASFSLMVAMAIMISSFRGSVERWLDEVLPADLYVRAAQAGDTNALAPAVLEALAATPGVARVTTQAVSSLSLDPRRPPVALLVRPIDPADPGGRLPLVGAPRAPPPERLPIYVSEAVASVYGWRAGTRVELPVGGRMQPAYVAAVWRDYARLHGAIAVDGDAWQRLGGVARVSDAALWLAPGATPAAVIEAARARVPGGEALLITEPGRIRELSLRIFDRSFAITWLLQAVAIAIGIAAVAATFGGEALARRREFGVLRHLGLARADIARMLAAEGALLAACGVAIGALLGTAISLVLIEVVNPQSFHWTMDLDAPWALLALLAVALLGASALTARWAARGAMSAAAVQAVREDW
jgi:putative ABC transport system permease protein